MICLEHRKGFLYFRPLIVFVDLIMLVSSHIYLVCYFVHVIGPLVKLNYLLG